jgi:hypothetical protein
MCEQTLEGLDLPLLGQLLKAASRAAAQVSLSLSTFMYCIAVCTQRTHARFPACGSVD